MRFQERVVVVTGAARGIGRACAERFLAEGARVVLADVGDLEPVREELAAGQDRARFVRADVGRSEDVAALVRATLEAFGQVDVLVNNAGITHAADFLTLPEADWDRVLRTNLTSMFLCSQAVAREMVRQGRGGVIVNMSSVNAVVALPNQTAYVASKGGVDQLTKAMALSLAEHAIRVAAVGPGTILTEMARAAVMEDASARRTVLSRTPLRRFGEPAEIAGVVAFLASDDGAYVTGTTVYADGGRLALNYLVPVEE